MKKPTPNKELREVTDMTEKPLCPECGAPLSLELSIDKETSELIISLWCESMYDDNYGHQIRTGLTQVIVDGLTEVNHVIETKMDEIYDRYRNQNIEAEED